MEGAPAAPLEEYRKILEFSWIYHDSALEGVVYSEDELHAALRNEPPSDTSLVPVFDEIRQNKAAIEALREMADKKRLNVTLEVIKRIYATLAPEEMEGKGPPKYRKDMPLHRMYFHDISTPDKISYKMRQLIQWMNSAETKRSTHTLRLAAKAHYQLLHIYPFPKHSGKVARLMMNLLLLRGGYPPAIIHATERQRYYDALKTSDNATARVVNDALVASIESAIRFFEMEAATRDGRRVRSA
ncbi:MAG: Fic family protein [Sandaracinaceae bacterium]|nr:Fic family protein [Sandaracinaceae bacterium]MCC6876853.1 Fic family protein [Sandaracinaceae bacterium]